MLLDGLMREWMSYLDDKARGHLKEAAPATAGRLDLHRLEGLALSLLCNYEVEVRLAALGLLSTTRTLHRAIAASLGGYHCMYA